MSIFKETFKTFVRNQLEARQNIVSETGNNRSKLFNQYTSGKACWSRMVSLVDYDSPDGKYKGQDLSRKYILQGGTLYSKNNSVDIGEYALRSGLGSKESAYGGNLGNRMYGYRPMPGISDIKVDSKTAYGSLREATVSFYCWDKKQLDELEILFMRPNYGVLLEWGWSMYMPTNDKFDLNSLVNNGFKKFDSPTINPFQSSLKQDDLYKSLDSYREKFSGNYDGMFGFVKNFSWDMLPNGGFHCTTTLISAGEVIEAIKVNASNIKTTPDNQDDKTTQPIIENFEKFINELILSAPKLASDYPKGVQPNIVNVAFPNKQYNYIQLAYFIYEIDQNLNIFNTGGNKIFNMELPIYDSLGFNIGNGLCLASDDSVSIDPRVCLIRNSKATFVCNNNDGFLPFNPTGYYKNMNVPILPSQGSLNNVSEYIVNKFGQIGEIYVSMDHIKDVFKSILGDKSKDGDVTLINFLNTILKNISFSLGGINDFGLFTSDNNIVIIDKNYCEINTSSNNKFKLNIIGTESVVRKSSISSKIFPSQSNMIAVAAGVGNSLGSVHSSTYTALNEGMKNRIFIQSYSSKDQEEAKKLGKTVEQYVDERNKEEKKQKEEQVRNDFIDRVIRLRKYVHGIVNFTSEFSDSNVNSARSILFDLLTKVNMDTNYKALIPISFEATVDGIGGIVIGEIFTINTDILPKAYSDKNIGFAVTKLGHQLSRNDWTTTFSAYVVLLDQESRMNIVQLKELMDWKNSFQSSVQDKELKNIQDAKDSIFYFNLLMSIYYDLKNKNIGFNYSTSGKSKKELIEKNIKEDSYLYLNTTNGKILKIDTLNLKDKNIEKSNLFQSIGNDVNNIEIVKNGLNIYRSNKNINTSILKKLDPVESDIFKISDILDKTFKNSEYYKKMNNEVRNIFDSKFTKSFIEDVDKENGIIYFFDESIAVDQNGNINIGALYSKNKQSVYSNAYNISDK